MITKEQIEALFIKEDRPLTHWEITHKLMVSDSEVTSFLLSKENDIISAVIDTTPLSTTRIKEPIKYALRKRRIRRHEDE